MLPAVSAWPLCVSLPVTPTSFGRLPHPAAAAGAARAAHDDRLVPVPRAGVVRPGTHGLLAEEDGVRRAVADGGDGRDPAPVGAVGGEEHLIVGGVVAVSAGAHAAVTVAP